jgi:ParB-like nuclease domain
MKLSNIKPNPKNPRIIKDDKFKKLVQSIKDFPEMMEKRPMVCVTDVDKKIYPLGGNMRLKAIQELGHKEIPDTWVMLADSWTQEQRKEFIIKDNVGYGEWDWDDLANNWDAEQLTEWGLDIPNFENTELNYSDKNEEIDIDDLDGTMTIKLNFTEAYYWQVKQQLSEIASTPEQAVWKLLGNE